MIGAKMATLKLGANQYSGEGVPIGPPSQKEAEKRGAERVPRRGIAPGARGRRASGGRWGGASDSQSAGHGPRNRRNPVTMGSRWGHGARWGNRGVR